jgi:hypothetical protein
MQSNRPDVLDDLLEITFVHVPTHKVLKRARFYIWADEATSRWIRNHPTFSRGCWPVALFMLHDWMWEKKIIDVEIKEIVEGGIVDPRVGTTFIRSELENFEEGVWLAPLFNLANTHLYDQLKQFYLDFPEAKTAPERVPEIFAEEKAKAEAKQRARAVAQLQRQHLLKRPVKHVRVFIDESGDVGFKQIDDVYVLAPVIIPEALHEQVAMAIDDLRAKHWGSNPPAEIHMSKIADPKRAAVKADMARIILDNKLTVIGCTIEKRSFIKHLFRCHAASRYSEEFPLDVTWMDLINDREYYLQANTLATTVELIVMHLALDFLTGGTSAVFTHDRKHRPWMNDALDVGFSRGIAEARKLSNAYFGLDVAPLVSFGIADSVSDPCLWLSDWISNELRAWCYNVPFSAALESIKPCMSFLGFRTDGVKCSSKDIGGVADHEFPDLPRPLVRGNPADGEDA